MQRWWPHWFELSIFLDDPCHSLRLDKKSESIDVEDRNSANDVSDNASDEGSYRTLPDDTFAWADKVLEDNEAATQENQPFVTALVAEMPSGPSPMDS